MKDTQITQLNGSALAYVGDGVYELFIRQHVLAQGLTQVDRLHKATVKYVEASGQAFVMKHWLKIDALSQDEITYYKRGRNHRSNTRAKNASIRDYRQATGFESLLGWLYLTKQQERLEELMDQAIALVDDKEANDETTK